MEWLSHSQKKHCELCKTPFTFTKLYSPDMPSSVPATVFLSRAAAHVANRIIFWARAVLVAFTWLVWLPWTMRLVWWGLFWLADFGFMYDVDFQDGGIVQVQPGLPVNTTTPRADPFEGSVMLRLITMILFTRLPESWDQHESTPQNVTAAFPRPRQTLLSGVALFKSPALNRVAADIAEGLIITILLVAAIILVLLIREWVVQQQPIINNMAAAAADDNAAMIPNPVANVDDDDAAAQDDDADGDEDDASEGEGTAEAQEEAEAEDDSLEPVIDPSLLEWPALETLCVDMANEQSILEDFRPGDLLGSTPATSMEQGQRKYAARSTVIRLYNTVLAIEHLSDEDNESLDHEALEGLRQKAERLQVALEPFHNGLCDQIMPRLEQVKQSLDGRLTTHEGQAMAIDSEQPQTETSSRPSMPVREESSIATDVQRNLQESVSDVQTSAANEVSRNSSDGSWQEISQPQQTSLSDEDLLKALDESNGESSGASQPRPQSTESRDESDIEFILDRPQQAEPRPEPQRGLYESTADWLWGDIVPANDDAVHENDEHMVDDLDVEEPFVPFNNAADAQPQPQPELVPNEADLIEDAEELEGVLELIGMQGPLLGLMTNALFAAVFISCTMSIAVWLPFLLGKLVLIWVAYPVSITNAIFQASLSAVDILVDTCIYGFARAASWTIGIPLNWISAWKGSAAEIFETPLLGKVALWFLDVINQSSARLAAEVNGIVSSTGSASEHVNLDSHVALSHIKSHASYAFTETTSAVLTLRQLAIDGSALELLSHWKDWKESFEYVASLGKQLPRLLWSGHVTFSHNATATLVEANNNETFLQLADWTSLDRGLTVTIGYAAVATLAALYFSKIAPISRGRDAQRIEQTVLDVLQQTGGIAKVVLIISIEMLAFPLYCGLLLDFAMLPLFSSASIESRLKFTIGSPWTSIFVHWFIGTCYMFHFALFVAMCRRILRNGVLHFIRDPDDPTFHPVRDVLERSVISQLRKIVSSALIYGGLVIVCLGSVLWLLAYGITGVLPIKWTSENVLFGFPVDLLLYTTLKPLLIKFLAPTDWLQQVYDWWFRRSARALRLSHYLFGDDNEDEHSDNSGSRWVRVPNNDQVRIGAGQRAWTDVDAENRRLDGWTEPTDVPGLGPQDTNFIKVYIPPHFRLRITLFITSLWALTAGAGFAMTVLPLIFGRSLFAFLLPRTLWANDIYAFSFGLVSICAVSFAAMRSPEVPELSIFSIGGFYTAAMTAIREYAGTLSGRTKRLMRCVYVYGFVAFVLPSLFALLSEFYVLGPIHAWLTQGKEAHTIEMLRSWTLGVQYVRLSITVIQWMPQSTPARALRAVVAQGYLNPDAGKASRYFFVPVMAAGLSALLIPTLIGLGIGYSVAPLDAEKRRMVCSMTFPAILGMALSVLLLQWIFSMLRGWRLRIRDEVYLIGERLHNYGEKSAPPKTKTS